MIIFFLLNKIFNISPLPLIALKLLILSENKTKSSLIETKKDIIAKEFSIQCWPREFKVKIIFLPTASTETLSLLLLLV